jgi:hypothetical protein
LLSVLVAPVELAFAGMAVESDAAGTVFDEAIAWGR